MNCPECHGKGEVLLFNSKSPCKTCQERRKVEETTKTGEVCHTKCEKCYDGECDEHVLDFDIIVSRLAVPQRFYLIVKHLPLRHIMI